MNGEDGKNRVVSGGGFARRLCARVSLPVAGVLVLVATVFASSAQAVNTSVTFAYTGAEQTFTVPGGVSTLQVLAVGGKGANGDAIGGQGAEVSANLSVHAGEVLYIEVGGNGGPVVEEATIPGAGGFNGGGITSEGAGGGGGATDLRTSPLSVGLAPDPRVLVAGGGGGGGDMETPGIAGNGGAAGEAGESNGLSTGGGPGTLTGPGSPGEGDADKRCKPATGGQLGMGGEGSTCCHSHGDCITGGGGAGGGGYYGGGGGGAHGSMFNGAGSGGGGGSSLVPAGGTQQVAPLDTEPQVRLTYLKLPVPADVAGSAAGISQRSAKLSGTVDPEGSRVTNCRFEYGVTRFYGLSARCARGPGSGRFPVGVAAYLKGLLAGSTYHYRLIATNAAGTGYSGDRTFATLPNAPAVLTASASAITQTDATFTATVEPERGSILACRVEFGRTIPYESSAPCTQTSGSASGPVTVSASVDDLSADSAYHFRIVATNAGGTTHGADEVFSTLAAPAMAFAYTGMEQSFTVPTGISRIGVLAVGGAGSAPAQEGGPGGLGAQVTGELGVTPGETLYVEVGGNGAVGAGGFNGGGGSGGDSHESGGGGGASDVRTSPMTSGLEADPRLLLAGGGGGGARFGGAGGAAGEAGQPGSDQRGEYETANPVSGGGPGTQSQGGIGGKDEGFRIGGGPGQGGKRGQGGEGGASNSPGGGGGGGYFGGGGGAGSVFGGASGGGGGSSLVPTGGTLVSASLLTPPQVQIFLQARPVVSTDAASGIERHASTLAGTVDSEGEALTYCIFEYGTSASYGASVPCRTLPSHHNSPVTVTARVRGLKPRTTYHFRVVSASGAGASFGTDESFMTRG